MKYSFLHQNILSTSPWGIIDLEVTQLWNPLQMPNGDEVYVSIKNTGYNPIDSISFSYVQQDGSKVFEPWKGLINAGDSALYLFQQTFIPSAKTNYNLCVYANVFQDIDTTNNYKCLSIPLSTELGRSNDFQLLPNTPNPCKENTIIRFHSPKNSRVQFRGFDISGRNILEEYIDAEQGINTYQFKVSNFEAGVYYYSAIYEGQRYVGKFVEVK